MATMLEAEPFVRGLVLERLADKPFELYGRGGIRLIISGIGKTNASTACTHFIHCFAPSIVCNLGAAGATGGTSFLGDCLHISRIIEPDRPDLHTGIPREYAPDMMEGFSDAALATQDRPIRDASERQAVSELAHLVDMEGASIAQVCRLFGRRCYLFKFVSDTPCHTTSSDIRTNISLHRDAFFRFFREEVLPRLERMGNEHSA